MWFKAVFCLLALPSFGLATEMARVAKQTGVIQVYAYGTNISGLPVYAGEDGMAFVSESSSGLTTIDWHIDSTGELPWNVTGNFSTTAERQFYIVTTSGVYEQVGFVEANSSLSSGAVKTGFVTYGAYIMYLENNTMVSEFWAQATNTTGVWALKWNEDGLSRTDSVPVSLKTMAPTRANSY